MQSITPHLDVLSTVVLFGIFLNIALAALIIYKKQKEHNMFLAFLGVLTLIQAESFLNRSGYFMHLPFLINVSIPLVFLIGPLLYGYNRGRLSWMHFVPFIMYFGYSFFFFLQPDVFKENVIIRNFHPEVEITRVAPLFDTDPLDIQGWVVVELLSAHMLLYSLLSLRTAYKKTAWGVFISIILLTGSLALFFSQGGIVNGYVFLKNPFPHYAADLWVTIAMYCIVLYLLLNPQVFKTVARYSKSSLPDAFRKTNLEKIRAVVESEKLYLDPGFSVDLLSAKSGITKHHISQVLNEELKVTFYEFTHSYRIDEAKKLLKSSEDFKVEQLAYQVGYRSKATFFNAFKKATDLTPSQYKVFSHREIPKTA